MLNQVTRALFGFLKPVASQQSSADRDPSGSTFENLRDQGKEKKRESKKTEESPPEQISAASDQPTAQVIPFPKPIAPKEHLSEEQILEARKKEIGNSQGWMALVTSLSRQKTKLTESLSQESGSGAYQKANTGSSRAARTKKGVIVDKKAA